MWNSDLLGRCCLTTFADDSPCHLRTASGADSIHCEYVGLLWVSHAWIDRSAWSSQGPARIYSRFVRMSYVWRPGDRFALETLCGRLPTWIRRWEARSTWITCGVDGAEICGFPAVVEMRIPIPTVQVIS